MTINSWPRLKNSLRKRHRDLMRMLGREYSLDGPPRFNVDISRFAFAGRDIAADVTQKYGPQADFLDLFTGTSGALVNKWHHYLPLYERYFGPWRDRKGKPPLRFLEIGVYRGGSLAMWRRYLGPDAIIYGIDIDPYCARYDGEHAQVRIGSQDDPAFLARVVAEMGGVDVILDDGSHVVDHIEASFKALYPLLSQGGTYMIEDLHTSYWHDYRGGYATGRNSFDFLRKLIDDMHHWYHDQALNHPGFRDQIAGIHIHDSVAVIEKAQVFAPVYSMVGTDPLGPERGTC